MSDGERRYAGFAAGAGSFATMTDLLRAAEAESARVVGGRPIHRACAIHGVLPGGKLEYLGDLVVKGGGYELQSIEPVPFDGAEGEG